MQHQDLPVQRADFNVPSACCEGEGWHEFLRTFYEGPYLGAGPGSSPTNHTPGVTHVPGEPIHPGAYQSCNNSGYPQCPPAAPATAQTGQTTPDPGASIFGCQSMGMLATPYQHPSAKQWCTPPTPVLPATCVSPASTPTPLVYAPPQGQPQQLPDYPPNLLLQGYPSAGNMVTTSQSSSQLPYYPTPEAGDPFTTHATSSMSAWGAHASPTLEAAAAAQLTSNIFSWGVHASHVLEATAAAQLSSTSHAAGQVSFHSIAPLGDPIGPATAPATTDMPAGPALDSALAPTPPEPVTTALAAYPTMSCSHPSAAVQQARGQGPAPPIDLPPATASLPTQAPQQQLPQARRSGGVRSQDPVKATEIWDRLTTGQGLAGVRVFQAPPRDPPAPGPPRRFLARLADMDRYLFYNSGFASKGALVPVAGRTDVFFVRRSVSVCRVCYRKVNQKGPCEDVGHGFNTFTAWYRVYREPAKQAAELDGSLPSGWKLIKCKAGTGLKKHAGEGRYYYNTLQLTYFEDSNQSVNQATQATATATAAFAAAGDTPAALHPACPAGPSGVAPQGDAQGPRRPASKRRRKNSQ